MGFLRFVLESEGYEVVAQASSAAELARVLALHRPDVVVLDDGIGATAVQMTHDVSPGAKVILVWPGAVVPIGGYARVDPGDVLRSLGPTVARAVGTMPAPRESVITPDWMDRVKKDPAALREKLEERDGPPTTHPSVTDLQRRGQHLHPVADTETAGAEASALAAGIAGHPAGDVQDEDLAPVLPLSALSMPPAAWASTIPESATRPATGEGATTEALPAAAGEWNRRLGTIALGGAVAASAVVIALTLGGAGARQGILSAAGFVQEPSAVVAAAPGASLVGGTGQADLLTGTTGVVPIPPSGPVAPGKGGPHAGGGGAGGEGGGGGGTGGGGGGNGGGAGGGGGGAPMPGRSALHNPFGGPPGQTRSHVKGSNHGGDHGKGHGGDHGKSGAAHDHASQRGNSQAHASQNGQDHRHKG